MTCILLAEDQLDQRTLYHETLVDAGYVVHVRLVRHRSARIVRALSSRSLSSWTFRCPEWMAWRRWARS